MQMKYLGTDSNDFLNGFFRENGIWVSDGAQDIATKFSEEEQEALYALEDTSWWFRYRSGVISHFAGKYLSKKQLILDVGGGVMAIRRCECRKKAITWLFLSQLMQHVKMQGKGGYIR